MSDWLNNFGYSKTLTLFNEATSMVCKDSPELLDERRQIMKLINDRQITEATRRTNALAPEVLSENKHLALQLKIQEFVEFFALIKSGNLDAQSEYLEKVSSSSDLSDQDVADTLMDTSASTSAQNPTVQQNLRNKRSAADSLQGEAKSKKRSAPENVQEEAKGRFLRMSNL